MPTPERIQPVVTPAALGYTDGIVLSHEVSCYVNWFSLPPEQRAKVAPDWHHLHISDVVLLALRDQDVSAEDVETMLAANTKRSLERT